jgi:hypothetical protein
MARPLLRNLLVIQPLHGIYTEFIQHLFGVACPWSGPIAGFEFRLL